MDRAEIIDIIKKNSSVSYITSSSEEENNFLFIVQDLDFGGANTVLIELLESINTDNRALWMISPSEGPYLEKMLSMGINVIIRPSVACPESLRNVFHNFFDLVFLNTVSVHFYAAFWINTPVRVLWWFHESELMLKQMTAHFVHPALLSSNFTLLGVTPKVQKSLLSLYGVSSVLFPMAIQDCSEKKEAVSDKTIFFIPGAYSYIKGQDLLLEVIARLPEEYIQSSHFIFAGYSLDTQKDYKEKVFNLGNKLPNVEMHEALSREEVYDYYRLCDCVVAPSREDSAPTSIVEGMMFEKICLTSTGAGISELLTDCVNSFVFANENADELYKRLLLIIAEKNNLSSIAAAGRKIYEQNYLPESVCCRFENLIK